MCLKIKPTLKRIKDGKKNCYEKDHKIEFCDNAQIYNKS